MSTPDIITREELDKKLDNSPAPRVTDKYIRSRIASTAFITMSGTVTLCQITLDNGFSVRGESACVNPANYNREIGEKISFDNAFRQLWPLFGFLLAEKNLMERPTEDPTLPSTAASPAPEAA